MSNDIETVDVTIPVDKRLLMDRQRIVRIGWPCGNERHVGPGGVSMAAMAMETPWWTFKTDGPRLVVEPVAPIDPPLGYDYGGYGIVPDEDDVLWLDSGGEQSDAAAWNHSSCPYRPEKRVDGGRRHWARKIVDAPTVIVAHFGSYSNVVNEHEDLTVFHGWLHGDRANAYAAMLNARETT